MSAKIIGFQSFGDQGILKATSVTFHPETNRIIPIKGASGTGKSTFLEMLKSTVIGTKCISDANFIENNVFETQISENGKNFFIGFEKTDEGFSSFLYMRDEQGNKVVKPEISGEQMTASKWQKLAHNQLTWNYKEFISDNATTHKQCLLKLFQSELSSAGVIFDTKDAAYKGSILDQIDKAKDERSFLDRKRKECGGFKGALQDEHGINVEITDTLPKRQDIALFDSEVARLNQALGNLEADKANQLLQIVNAVGTLTNSALLFNKSVNERNAKKQALIDNYQRDLAERTAKCNALRDALHALDLDMHYSALIGELSEIEKPENIELETLILFKGENNDKIDTYTGTNETAKKIIADRDKYQQNYNIIKNTSVGSEQYNERLAEIEIQKKAAIEANKICDSVDAYFAWAEADGLVKKLTDEYVRLLAGVNVGVEGMRIEPIGDNDIYLTYNGCHDPEYFQPQAVKNKTPLKYLTVQQYSTTQRPMLTLLLQARLLESKPRALRYLFIDDVPIDKRTQAYLADMCEKLNLWVFVNITGDFEVKNLRDGEILIENGELLFNPDSIQAVAKSEVKAVKNSDDLF